MKSLQIGLREELVPGAELQGLNHLQGQNNSAMVPSNMTFLRLSSCRTIEKAASRFGQGRSAKDAPADIINCAVKTQEELERPFLLYDRSFEFFVVCAFPIVDFEQVQLLPVTGEAGEVGSDRAVALA